MTTKNNKFKVIGTRPIRHDGTDKVTGRAQYGADFSMPRMLSGKILRSPHAHAKIISIDTSSAEKIHGVEAIITGKDLPETANSDGEDRKVTLGELSTDLKYLREGIMATEKAVFKGQPIAAVAATNVHIAEEACKAIKISYEVLDAVITAPEAMKANAPIIQEDLRTTELGEKLNSQTNIAEHLQDKLGDVDKGFDESDIVIEREFNTSTVHQGYIEPHNCVAHWRDDGRIHIWNTTQGPFNVRDATAEVLNVSLSAVKLTPLEIGGGFGGKFEPYLEPVAAILSKKTGRPVKIVMTRSEELEATGPTPGSNIRVKIGATKEGKLVAAEAVLKYEAGAFPGSPVAAAAACVFAPYNIPNQSVDGYDVLVNKTKTAAYRAPGATNAEFASETIIDELAHKLNIDPIEFRLMNASNEGTRATDGTKFHNIGLTEVLEAMKNDPHYKSDLSKPKTQNKIRGRGVAVGFWMNAGLQSSVNLALNQDGTVNLTEGSPDIGGSRTSISMQAAEVLGIKAEDVHPSVVDTDSIGYTFGTGGSRTTFATGWAAYEAAKDLKNKMIERAALIWDVDSNLVSMNDGVLNTNGSKNKSMTFKELAIEMNGSGGPIMGQGTVDPKGVGKSFAGLIVDIELDTETGKTQILKVTCVQDCGKAIHPSYVEGQMQGGTVQGIGWALNEEYYMDRNAKMSNNSLLDYRMPTSLDLPMINTVIVEVPNEGHPFGVRGVGEVNIVAPPAAIANAISDAAKIRMEVLPMNPQAVLKTINENNRKL
ncbi:MAG: xanthine dehydrogenase family protein molybdopterin-binding subunit [SAR202 cluster bacterium]|nr:xanthine dehydrogenase family protein molybdopterin-binding subunit [SAR202 cluster bacterium]|tara:strand:+ start:16500 stop:18800 length:2301 start_codon:yes stop_codon:yes gene_type:complete